MYVDLRALRNDRVSLVERGSPHSLCLLESGKLLPGVKVIIANPDTKGQCGDSHLGEVCPSVYICARSFSHLTLFLVQWNMCNFFPNCCINIQNFILVKINLGQNHPFERTYTSTKLYFACC